MEDVKKGNGLSRRSFLKSRRWSHRHSGDLHGIGETDPAEAYTSEAVKERPARRRSPSRLTARATASRWSTATPWPRCCAISWVSPAPRSAATAANAAPARSLLTVVTCIPVANWPSGWKAKRFSPSKAWPRATNSIRYKKPSSSMTGRSAASALPVRSCRAGRCS